MADELDIEVKIPSKEQQRISQLRKERRDIEKEIKQLQSLNKDAQKVEDWKMIHELRQEVKQRLNTVGVSWKRFLETPDWFEYAYKDGNRIKTSLTKPDGITTSEADMKQMAMVKRIKMVSAKKRKKKTATGGTPKPKVSQAKSGIR